MRVGAARSKFVVMIPKKTTKKKPRPRLAFNPMRAATWTPSGYKMSGGTQVQPNPEYPRTRPSKAREKPVVAREEEAGSVDCVILAVDTAETSGWAIYECGIYRDSGEFNMLKQPRKHYEVCALACDIASEARVPVVMVFERPFKGSHQGQYIGAWKIAWASCEVPMARTKGYYPSEWRAAFKLAGLPRDKVRAAELDLAGKLTLLKDLGHDEAAAICFGAAVMRSDKVRELARTKRKRG